MKTLEFGRSRVSTRGPVYVIAEVGHNHQGNIDTAKKMIKVPASCGVQAVKFQKRLKILYITSRSDYGGGAEHIHQLLRKFSGEFKLFVACPRDEPYFTVFSRFADCIEIPHRKVSVKSLRTLYKTIRKKKIDLIHSHGKGGGVYARALGAATRTPVIHTFHGLHYSHLSAPRRFASQCVERILGRFTSIFINVSESESCLCLKLKLFKKEKSVVIPNGVEVPAFRQRRRHGGEFRIINVSRHARQKGIDRLLDVMAALSLLTKDFKLLLVGDGPDRKDLERQAVRLGVQEQVEFLGFRDDVPELLDSADLYLSSARWEGMPLSILEALVRALPVVASDVVGNRDVIKDEEGGFLYGIDSPGEAAEKVLRLMNDKELYEACSLNAYLSAAEKYSVDRMCESTKDVYLSVSGQK